MQLHRIKTISEYHKFMALSKPEHPLISVINFEDIKSLLDDGPKSLVHAFYFIALKRNFNGKLKYGQQEYDFDEGILLFIAPGQVFSVEAEEIKTYGMFVAHPSRFFMEDAFS